MNVSALKNLSVDRILEMDEAIAMSAQLRLFETECAQLGQPIPEWVEKSSNVLREEIARRTHAGDLAELRRIESELEGYKTVSERRTDAERRLDAVRRKLGIGTKVAASTRGK